ncbi:adenine phosphoribosyltransferase [candidate division WOR_3 bacterium SM23_60]|uniref:Adenine phosphoribosyltransferase n=1 Tax=candidate division WOR_3 bacterium SM23_60 TaxID=1703780 RepID=A0A0S8GBB9_UNCW3|nr:MAG: adenine phosphoribosyltransferase [candidate division WOR_3 bacterium SM23_60]
MDLKEYIRNIPDFPKKGILFRDITTLLKEPRVFKEVIDQLANHYKNMEIDKIASVEARGYIFGGALAYLLGCGFVPVRKPGKLPAKTTSLDYALEYGTNTIEMHTDAITQGEKVLVFDDLLATGGTVQATCRLVESLGGTVVGCAFLISLTELKGIEKLQKYDVFSLIEY